MILEETFDLLRNTDPGRLEGLTIADLRIGRFLTAVKLSDGSTGLAGTVAGDEWQGSRGIRDFSAFSPGCIVGKPVSALFHASTQPGLLRTMRVATLNALSSGLLEQDRYRVLDDTDPIDTIDLGSPLTITLVGAFRSYIRRIAGTGHRLSVLEADPRALDDDHRQFYRPADTYRQVIPGSDVVIITGMTLVNGTIDGLLEAVAPGTRVIVTGPSAGMIPDILFRNRVSLVGATRITRPDLLFDIVSQGATGFHLFRCCARKICIVKDPGVQRVPPARKEGEEQVAALIAAAGLSERMGRPKALLRWDDHTTFLERIIGECLEAGCDRVVCTVNRQILPFCISLPQRPEVRFVLNEHPERGRMHSIKLGLRELEDASYCLLQNVDNPFVTAGAIRRILAGRDPGAWTSPEYHGKGGHPVVLPQAVVRHILGENESVATLQEILATFPRLTVPMEDDSFLRNINTPEKYRELFE